MDRSEFLAALRNAMAPEVLQATSDHYVAGVTVVDFVDLDPLAGPLVEAAALVSGNEFKPLRTVAQKIIALRTTDGTSADSAAYAFRFVALKFAGQAALDADPYLSTAAKDDVAALIDNLAVRNEIDQLREYEVPERMVRAIEGLAGQTLARSAGDEGPSLV